MVVKDVLSENQVVAQLAVEQRSHPELPTGDAAICDAPAPGAGSRQVLLVEDNPGDADLVRAALQEVDAEAAFELHHVQRLGEALLRVAQGGVDAVLLDLSLPDSLGLEGVERLRAAAPGLPIVVLTGMSGVGLKALTAGAQDYLVKGQLDGPSIQRALMYSIERQRRVERERELAVERAAREASESGAKLIERAYQDLLRAASEAREAAEREVAARADAEQKGQELEALFVSMVDGVIVYGADRRIKATNPAAEALFGDVRGLTPQEFLGRAHARGAEGRELPEDSSPSARALGGATVAAERLRVRMRSGERTMLVSASPLRPGRGAVLVYRDVTEYEQAEQALRDADRHKSEFLAMLSHELRNPLAPIRNSVYILDRAAPGGEQARRAHAVIDRQVQHLTRLVDDLLDVTRISRGKVRLKRERIDLGELARRCAEDHRSIFATAAVALEVVAAAEPIHVLGDPTRLAQVIGNLLQNAAKFTPRSGRATLAVKRADNGFAAVHLRDDGEGIAPGALTHLFEPFVQGERTLDRSRGGLGLGLALVKGLVELHGGTVTARSDGPGMGAEFVATLPLERRAAPRESRAARPAGAGSARRVLIIEDNLDAAVSLKEALEMGEHVVEVAFTGPEGIEKARSFRPEVVLCDIGLPGMDGYELARRMRSEPSLRSIPLVALSGYASAEDVEMAMAAGFDRHLAKPPGLEQLERTLGELAAGKDRG
jgi:two-component system CheB/CheR fusion protein